MLRTTTIGAYPKPPDIPVRDWFQQDGTDVAEPSREGAAVRRAPGGDPRSRDHRGRARAGGVWDRHLDRDPVRERHPLPLPPARRLPTISGHVADKVKGGSGVAVVFSRLG